MSPWEKVIERPDPHGHLVQLYGADKPSLAHNVGQYLLKGFKGRDGLLVIADSTNVDLFRAELKQHSVDVDAAIEEGQLHIAPAQEILSRFMRHGQPDWNLFESVMTTEMRQVRWKTQGGGLRAYSQMTGVLWKAGQFSAAIRLEHFWNKLLGRSSFSLFCGYEIDVFGEDFQIAHLDALLSAHTHLLPGANGRLEPALNLAMAEILGTNTRRIKPLSLRPSWAIMPRSESAVLWLRNNLPNQAGRILARARDLCYRVSLGGVNHLNSIAKSQPAIPPSTNP